MVVIQLMEDVERREIGHIIFVGVQYARGVTGVRIGIDVEIALHLTTNNVDVLAQRSWCALFTIGCTANKVERQLIRQMMR